MVTTKKRSINTDKTKWKRNPRIPLQNQWKTKEGSKRGKKGQKKVQDMQETMNKMTIVKSFPISNYFEFKWTKLPNKKI